MNKKFWLIYFLLVAELSAEVIPLINPTDYRSDGPDAGARISADVSLAARGKPSAIFYNPALAIAAEENVLVISGRTQSPADDLAGRGIIAINLGGPKGVLSWRRISDFQRQYSSASDTRLTQFRLDEYLLTGVHKKNFWTVGLNLKYLSGAVAYQSLISQVPRALISYGYGAGLDLGIIFNPTDNFLAGLSLNNLATFVWWDCFDSQLIPEEIRLAMSFSPWVNLEIFGEYQQIPRQATEINRWGLKQKIPKTPLTIGLGEYRSAERHYLSTGGGLITKKFRLDVALERNPDKSGDERYFFSLQFAL